MLKNHNAHLYPEWLNTIKFSDTSEYFGTISLNDSTLYEALEFLILDDNNMNLTADQKCIAKSKGTELSFLPVVNVDERNLFTSICTPHGMIFSTIVSTWNDHVNGKKKIPKLEAC